MSRPCVILLLMMALHVAAQQPDTKFSVRARAAANPLGALSTDNRIRAAEQGLQQDPGKMAVQSELISAYLQKVRESGDFTYLQRATKIVETMLDHDPSSDVAARFQNEIDLQWHRFRQVAERAAGMTRYNPSDSGSWANLGDASMELGNYDQAGQAYARMFALRPDLASYNRLAYFRFVTGDAASAITLMRDAVQAGSATPENTAWCWAELGDLYFKAGRLEESKGAYQSALQLFPRLHRALAGMGRIQAAQGSNIDAIASFQRAQSIVPLVEYAAALEDLYRKASMNEKAGEQRALIDAIDKISMSTKEKTNRNLAIIYADHNRNLPRALELLEAEIPDRGDVYTWDAMSWVLLKLGRVNEAKAASLKALQMNTPEPAFYYHASQIAQAAGDPKAAAQYTMRQNALNPSYLASVEARAKR